jgi:hypothetical protein
MDWFDLYVVVAMLLQVIALVVWCLLWRKVRPRVWWCITLGVVLTMMHSGGHFFYSVYVNRITVLSNAFLMAMAAFLAWRMIRDGDAVKQQLKRHADELEREVSQGRSAALDLATLLAEYRRKLEYYEKFHKDHNLPLLGEGPSSTA